MFLCDLTHIWWLTFDIFQIFVKRLTYLQISLAMCNWHFIRICLSVLLILFQDRNLFSHGILIHFPEKKMINLFLGQSRPANCINDHCLFTTSPLGILFGIIYAKVLIPFVSGFCLVFSSIYLRPVKSLQLLEKEQGQPGMWLGEHSRHPAWLLQLPSYLGSELITPSKVSFTLGQSHPWIFNQHPSLYESHSDCSSEKHDQSHTWVPVVSQLQS